MPRILQVAQLGNPVLREISGPTGSLGKTFLDDLYADMLCTMRDTNGVGIAAPQIYVARRCFIFSARPGPGRLDIPIIEPTVVLDPEILWVSEEKEKAWEACLSIPGIRGQVPRAKAIRVRYRTLYDTVNESALEGFPARVFQHEYDHLEGLVYLDRLESVKDIVCEKEYQNRINAQQGS
jgi:peptide deformylase